MISVGLALAVQQQIGMAMMLENELNLPPVKIMQALADAGLKLVADDTQVMFDASRLYPKLIAEDIKPDLKLVEE